MSHKTGFKPMPTFYAFEIPYYVFSNAPKFYPNYTLFYPIIMLRKS